MKLQSGEATQPELGPDLTNLQVSTDWKLGSDILHVRIADEDGKRYVIPEHLFAPSGRVLQSVTSRQS